MAKVFLTNINLKGNQLLNAALQPASSAPNASGAGQVYYNTNTQALYFSTGSGTGNWQQLAAGTTSVASLNNVTGPITLQGTTDYITVDTTGSTITINIDNKVATTDGEQSLSNKTFQGPTYFQSGGGAGGSNNYLDVNNNTGELQLHSGYDLKLFANNNINLQTNNADIILNPDGSAYLWNNGSNNNRIATIGNLSNFISTGDSASLNNLTTTSNGLGENVQIGDDAWLGDVNLGNTINVKGVEDPTQGYISFAQNGSLIDNTAQKNNYIGSNSTDLTLGSSNDIILLPDSGYAYLGTPQLSGANRIATLGDISTGAVTSVSGTPDQITVTMDGEAATISLPSYIDIPNGELHLKKTEYWLNGTQYGVIDANPYSNNFNIVATSHNLELESQGGYNTLLNSGNFTQITGNYLNSSANQNYFAGTVYIGQDAWNEQNTTGMLYVTNNQGNNEFVVDTDNDIVEFNRRGGNNGVRFRLNQWTDTVEFNNYTWLKFNGGDNSDEQGEIYIDGGFYFYGPNNSEIGLETNNNRIYLTTNNGHNIDFYTQGGGQVHAHTNVVINNDLTVGANGTDSNLYVQMADGTDVFQVDSGSSRTKLWGQLRAYGANGGGQYFNMYTDGGNEAILNAPNGDLILTADGAQYLNSNGSTDNLIATRGYVDNAVAGLSWKQSANLLWDDSNATLTGLSGGLIIDGHSALSTANVGYRILITSGTNAGIWVYEDDGVNWTLSRPADADTYEELKGAAIFIEEGNTYGQTSWVQSNHYLTNFTGQNWVQFSGTGNMTAGDGIAINGREISVHNDDTLKFTGGAVGVNYGDGITTGMDGEIIAHLGTGLTINSGAITFASGYGVRKYTDEITGDNLTDSFAITHNLGTRDVTVQIYQSSGTPDTQWQDVEADIVRTSTNAVTISFASAPTNTTTYNVVIVG